MARNPALRAIDSDGQFFVDHPDRHAHIRLPGKEFIKDSQRGIRVMDECYAAFFSLGEHRRSRRRIMLYRIPLDHPLYDPGNPQIMKIPFLLFGDETCEDRDDVLLPIIHRIMIQEAERLQRTTGRIW